MNDYLFLILTILVIDRLLGLYLRWLNHVASRKGLPPDFQPLIDPDRYATSLRYFQANSRFANVSELITTLALLVFILQGGFAFLDEFVRSYELNSVWTSLLYFAVMGFGIDLLSIPFSAYQTFVIEQRFGLNKTTVSTFALDILRSWLLTCLTIGPALWLILVLFGYWGQTAWIWVWLAISAYQLIVSFISPVLIMPLFYKVKPIEKGALKDKITSYMTKQSLTIKDVYTVDGSRRSTKANAFFTGFGESRRIVLFDTLLEKLPTEEIIAVLAHEVAHYKYRHVEKGIVLSVITTGAMCWLLSFFLLDPDFCQALGVLKPSLHISLICFGFIFSPAKLLLTIASKALCRHYERQADTFAALSHDDPDLLANALVRLRMDSLSNINPHPANVFFHHNHPPMIERVRRLRQMSREKGTEQGVTKSTITFS